MVRVFHIKDAAPTGRGGYSARYYADIQFRQHLETAGFIYVSIPACTQTDPHAHEELEELFIVLTPLVIVVDEKEISLSPGDLLMVEPNEFHSIRAPLNEEGKLVAIKCPNLKDDKKSIRME